ncbi:MAG: CZB domain-containing protein [Magnetococcales bacterium]|nr:CZB domain-containing protein [Magnetococcales bacterium]MBF0116011.1 CZB domain-containing protein [Magnetococcales bacterium]
MKQVDFCAARVAHVLWESELEEMVQQRRKTINLGTYKDCDLGVWLHGDGIRELYHLDSVRHLVKVHEAFHHTADRLVALIFTDQQQDIAGEMTRLRNLSRDIVYLVTEAELDYLEHKPLGDFSAHPVKSLIHRLFNIHIPEQGDVEKRGVLDVTYARLMHLRWSRQLLRAFQHWGKDAVLATSEACALGVWIQNVKSKDESILAIVKELEEKHQQFHAKAEETVRLLRRKNFRSSEIVYNDVVALGREVLYLLTRVELTFLQSGTVASSVNVFGH